MYQLMQMFGQSVFKHEHRWNRSTNRVQSRTYSVHLFQPKLTIVSSQNEIFHWRPSRASVLLPAEPGGTEETFPLEG